MTVIVSIKIVVAKRAVDQQTYSITNGELIITMTQNFTATGLCIARRSITAPGSAAI